MRVFGLSRLCRWGLRSSGVWSRVTGQQVPAISKEHTAFICKGPEVRDEMCDLLNGVGTVPIKIVAKLVGYLHGALTYFCRTLYIAHYALPKNNSCCHVGISFVHVRFSLMPKQCRTDSPWHRVAARATSQGANKKGLREHDTFRPQGYLSMAFSPYLQYNTLNCQHVGHISFMQMMCAYIPRLRFCSQLIAFRKWLVYLPAVTYTYTAFPASYDAFFFLKNVPQHHIFVSEKCPVVSPRALTPEGQTVLYPHKCLANYTVRLITSSLLWSGKCNILNF
jgi:hypothetical protein